MMMVVTVMSRGKSHGGTQYTRLREARQVRHAKRYQEPANSCVLEYETPKE
jgi:hypothetical protein